MPYIFLVDNTNHKVDSLAFCGELEDFTIPPDTNLIPYAITEAQATAYKEMDTLTHYMVHNPPADVATLVPIPENPATADKTSILANGIDKATISSIPTDTTVVLFEQFYTPTDGLFELNVDTPGTYTLTIFNPGYLKKEIVINAT